MKFLLGLFMGSRGNPAAGRPVSAVDNPRVIEHLARTGVVR